MHPEARQLVYFLTGTLSSQTRDGKKVAQQYVRGMLQLYRMECQVKGR
jgi:hypothetical protein